ncbi:site-specific DNA-methyltransferase (adenine-specific) [Nitratireductor indicus]|uniref:DNA methyltransferase n=1 Tax=Nitratireductor indicus TaxID=721133 RepID=UPI0008E3884E|nr:site-specific DNA-methyltransferase (adenine-specific) [Nitratireductor indicus]
MTYLLAKGNPVQPEHPIPDVLDFPYTGNKLHPTQKPVQALRPLIEAFTKPGELVLDPFCGSGSTLAAAQKLGRDWIGIELDSDHHGTASKRLASPQRHRPAA